MQAALGKEGVFYGTDYRNVRVLSVLKRIPDSPWVMVTKIDEAEALEDWRHHANFILTALTALVLARRRELSVLRHLGFTLGEVSRMIALQALVIVVAALGAGMFAGTLIGVVLVEVVNRQAFHWSMELHMPWGALSLLALAMCLLATMTGYLGGRGVASGEVVRAASEDW